jgi:hypothetical protein
MGFIGIGMIVKEGQKRAVGYKWHNAVGLIGKKLKSPYPEKDHYYTKPYYSFAELVQIGDVIND